MKSFRILGFLSLALLLGCIPDKRIKWSADGKTAAVSSDNGLFFIDRDGKVLAPRLKCGMSRCAWFDDGKRLAIAYVQHANDWAAIAPLFDEKATAAIAAESKKLREAILAYHGDWDKFEIDPEKRTTTGHQMAVLLYLLAHDAAGLAEKVGDPWKSIDQTQANIWKLQLFELSADQLKPGLVLHQGLDEISQPKISPKQSAVAMVMPDAGSQSGDEACLSIVPIAGGPARIVASNVSLDYDWKSDGQMIALARAHARTKDNEQLQLGSLTTIQVADESGKLLSQWAGITDRVGLIFNPYSGIRWLSDGRILFSSAEVTLPATTRDMPQQWTLFVWDPRMPASVTRALGRDFAGPLDPGIPLFEVSPDEQSVLIQGVKGHVLRYDFAGGDTTKIQDADDPDGKTRSLPTWRGKDEICYIGPSASKDGSKKASEVRIWSKGKSISISDAWPAEMKEEWLIDAKHD